MMRRLITALFAAILVLMEATQSPAQVMHPADINTPWPWRITSDFGQRDVCVGSWWHEGIDYGGADGEAIPAVEDGAIINIDYAGGWFITVQGNHGVWSYVHIFAGVDNTHPTPVASGSWELTNATLVNPTTGASSVAKVIILWSDSTRQFAQKVLSQSSFAGRRAFINGITTPVLGITNTEIRSQGSISASEAIAPVGTSGGANGYSAHLHLGYRQTVGGLRRNPLYHLTHTPSGQHAITIENPENNHEFTKDELKSNYPIKIDVNSTTKPDVNRVLIYIQKEDNPSQTVYLSNAQGDPTFGYTGAVDEYDTPWNSAIFIQSDGNTTGVQPYRVPSSCTGDSMGHDRFIYLQKFDDLHLPSGEHSLIARITDINGNSIERSIHFKIKNYPIVESTVPASGATGVSLTAPITITFDHEMNPTVTQAAVSVSPALQAPTYAWSNGNKILTIDDTYELDENTTYTVTVSDAAQDVDGNRLDGDKDGQEGGNYIFSFLRGPVSERLF